jgi:rhamnosyl/mannosyltransferase
VYRADQHLEITSAGFSLSALGPYRALVRWADIVHYHFPWPFADVLDLLAREHKPRVVTYHSDIVRQQIWLQLYRPLMRHFLAQADRLIVTSPNYAASSKPLQAYRDKLEIIPLGLDRQTYPEPTAKEEAAVQKRFGHDYFLFIGVLRYYKGLDTLLDAVRNTRLQVVIVGEGPEGNRLRTVARERGMRNVQFAGIVTDAEKVALIRRCHRLPVECPVRGLWYHAAGRRDAGEALDLHRAWNRYDLHQPAQ